MREETLEGIYRHITDSNGLDDAILLEYAPGHSKLAFDITPETFNLYGNIHGGVLFSLCDMSAGIAAYAYEIANVTQSSNIQFLRGASEGRIFIECNAVHKGKRTLVSNAVITDESGRTLVNATFTMFFIKPLYED